MKSVDLNVDVGEGGPFDTELLTVATSANVCCGEHAGSPDLARATVRACLLTGVRVGAHPGVPDRASMGRSPLPPDFDARALTKSVRDQIAFLVSLGAQFVKPHGELYNASARRPEVAQMTVDALEGTGLPLMGMAGSLHESVARKAGVRFIAEGFADRAYSASGFLAPRSEPGAVLTDPARAAAQALELAGRVDSICVHGDTEGCCAILRAVRTALEKNGYQVEPCG